VKKREVWKKIRSSFGFNIYAFGYITHVDNLSWSYVRQLWEALRYPLLCAFVGTVSLQLIYLWVVHGFIIMLVYAALLSLPLVRAIKKREDNYLKLLLHEH